MTGNRMLTAFFDNRTDAEQAIARLEKAGIPRSDVKLVEGENRASGVGATSRTSYEDTGFWASLSSLFMPDEDRHTYAEGLSRGGYLVSLHVSDAQYERALDILDDEGTINIDERANSWKSEGWGGYTGSRSTTGLTGGATSTARTTGLAGATSTARTSGLAGATSTARTSATGEQVIPVAEERLNIGKREEIAGRVRVRSYVVEKPVHEEVSLRQEHVSVERRPVDRTLTGAESAFKDRTIEATETAERAVVNKEARVTEEVVLHKNAETRKETINDTVRKTQVDVEDDRTKRGTGTTGVSGTTGTTRTPR